MFWELQRVEFFRSEEKESNSPALVEVRIMAGTKVATQIPCPAQE
jgi:hypothetical protein